MSFLTSSFLRPLAEWYSEINSATLTGALDVVVVEQPDGSFRSSPFHVRFGKLGVLKAREKIVDIEVNDEPVDVHMKLDAFGAAFFVEENDEGNANYSDDVEDYKRTLSSPNVLLEDRSVLEDHEKKPRGASSAPNREFSLQHPVGLSNTNNFDDDEEEDDPKSSGNPSGSNSRKKLPPHRRRRGKHARSASKSSLQELTFNYNKQESSNDEDKEQKSGFGKRFASKEEGDDPEHQTSFLQCRLSGQSIDTILNSQHQEHVVSNARPDEYFSEPENSSEAMALRPMSPEACLSDSEVDKPQPLQQEAKEKCEKTEQNWEWGQLPSTTIYEAKAVVGTSKELKEGEMKGNNAVDNTKGENNVSRRSRAWTFSFWRSTEANKAPHSTPNETSNSANGATATPVSTSVEGVYLDDLKDDEELISIYVGSSRHAQNTNINPMVVSSSNDDAESGKGASLPISPHSVEGAIGGPNLRSNSNYSSDDEQNNNYRSFANRLLPDIAFSLCGSLASSNGRVTSALFDQCLISYDDFVDRLRSEDIGSLINNPDLVVRIGDEYFSWSAAAPTIFSALLYGRKLPKDLAKNNKVTVGSVTPPKPRSSWWPFGGRGGNVDISVVAKDVSLESKGESDILGIEATVETGANSAVVQLCEQEIDVTVVAEEKYPNREHSYSKRKTNNAAYRKTLRLSSDLIKKLKLKPGVNEAQFSVTTQYQGTKRCKCHIYWWKWNSKIVVSDIDGTITKSDVLGHVLPIIGRDWAQSGVASLFNKIVGNGYKVLYLSARAIGQSSVTKDYLASIKQGDISLPDGPLLLNPTSLVSAFHREVVEKKPEVFKIACLSDIKSLFPNNPLYAGYGNRVNDVFAYRTVGIPISRIFTINSRGELRHELTQTFQTSYDCQSSIVDHVFPPVSDHDDDDEVTSSELHQHFSSFSHWRDPIQDINPSDLN